MTDEIARLVELSRRANDPSPVKVIRCSCGHPTCGKYGLSTGTFYQGAGWDKDTAEFYAALLNWFRATHAAHQEELKEGKK